MLDCLNYVVLGFLASFALSCIVVLTAPWHGGMSMDHTDGVQKFHTKPTPRIGGVPIVLGLIMAWGKAPSDIQVLLTTLLVAGMPAFLFGLAEDITKRIGVSQRLMATMVSGLLAWWLSGYSLTRVDVWGLDEFLQFSFLSVVFTAFAVGGVANSINIVDGLNGLASTTATLAFVGLAGIAWQVGDVSLVGLSLVLAACIWGFFWVNWPFGKLFMGDGGSYFVGFALAWVAVMLIERNSNVAAFAALVVCAHPIIEVVFSIYRRWLKKLHPGHPDRLHLHSLIKQRVIRQRLPHLSVSRRNSIAGLFVGAMTIPSVVLANLTYSSPCLATFTFLLLVAGYIVLYARLVTYKWWLVDRTQ